MTRTLIAGTGATADAALPLDVVARGTLIGDLEEVVIQVSDASVAVGDSSTQPVTLASSSTLTFEKANLSRIYVRSAAAGVPGIVSFLGWKEV